MLYQFEWQYCDVADDGINLNPEADYIHFGFLLRFPDVPLGKGHCAHFCGNVLPNPSTDLVGIRPLKRGVLICKDFDKSQVQRFVEETVAAMSDAPREVALRSIDEYFIHEDRDFSDEFVKDLIESDELLQLIEAAFNGVERGEISLHQANVIDDYGSQEEFLLAADLDTETRWQDVPDSDLAANPQFMNFLDMKGFRYYLAAAMSWAVRNCLDESDTFFTYLSVLPTVAPREVGFGLGEAFDLERFIEEHSFSTAQVNAIYRFIVFMAITAGHEMDEDQYAAVNKWQAAKD